MSCQILNLLWQPHQAERHPRLCGETPFTNRFLKRYLQEGKLPAVAFLEFVLTMLTGRCATVRLEAPSGDIRRLLRLLRFHARLPDLATLPTMCVNRLGGRRFHQTALTHQPRPNDVVNDVGRVEFRLDCPFICVCRRDGIAVVNGLDNLFDPCLAGRSIERGPDG